MRHALPRRGNRDPALCERDLSRYRTRNRRLFPELEGTPDVSRAEQRFAAEVAVAEWRGRLVPTFAHERAMQLLEVLAFG